MLYKGATMRATMMETERSDQKEVDKNREACGVKIRDT